MFAMCFLIKILFDCVSQSVTRLPQEPEVPGSIPHKFGHILSFLLPLINEGQLSVTGESMVDRLRSLSPPRNNVIRFTDFPDMTAATKQVEQHPHHYKNTYSETDLKLHLY